MVGKKEEIKRSFLKEELFLPENTLAIAFHPLEINFSRLWARNVEEICLTWNRDSCSSFSNPSFNGSWEGGVCIKFLPRARKKRERRISVGRFASIKMHERKKRLNGVRVYTTISNYVNKRGSLFIENYPFIEWDLDTHQLITRLRIKQNHSFFPFSSPPSFPPLSPLSGSNTENLQGHIDSVCSFDSRSRLNDF